MADDFDPEISYTFTPSADIQGDFNSLVISATSHTAAFLLAHVGDLIARITVSIDFGSGSTISTHETGVLYRLGETDVAFIADEHVRDDYVMDIAEYLLETAKCKQIICLDTTLGEFYRGEEGLKFVSSLNGSLIQITAQPLDPSNSVAGLSAAFLTISEIKGLACLVALGVLRNNNLSEENCQLFAPVKECLKLGRASYERTLYQVSVRKNTTSLYS